MKNKKAYTRALKLLSMRGYSEGELREKISENAEDSEVEEIIDKCRKERYLDDDALAEYLVTKHLKKGRGYNYLIFLLEKKKIREETVKTLRDNFDFEREFESAKVFFLKNRKKKKISTLIFSLKSRGFSYPTVNRIIHNYLKKKD